MRQAESAGHETLLQSSAISLACGELQKAVAGLHQVLTAIPDSAETHYPFGQGVPSPRGAGQLPNGNTPISDPDRATEPQNRKPVCAWSSFTVTTVGQTHVMASEFAR
jgi:hypothetical protein